MDLSRGLTGAGLDTGARLECALAFMGVYLLPIQDPFERLLNPGYVCQSSTLIHLKRETNAYLCLPCVGKEKMLDRRRHRFRATNGNATRE
jgi:hypothetical protein